MRRLFIIAAVFGLLSAPAFAQMSLGGQSSPAQNDEAAQKQMKEQVDRDYKATLKRTNPSSANAPTVDPWGTVREPAAGKTKR